MCREKLPVWQQKFEKYRSENFTVVGLALDAEGIAPAKLYYEKFGVEFPSLVDPNYATQFGVIPKTFFVNEHGVVQDLRNWESRLSPRQFRMGLMMIDAAVMQHPSVEFGRK